MHRYQDTIAYKPQSNGSVRVYVNKTYAGSIKQVDGGYQYWPRSSDGQIVGDVFPTLDECKRSLEG